MPNNAFFGNDNNQCVAALGQPHAGPVSGSVVAGDVLPLRQWEHDSRFCDTIAVNDDGSVVERRDLLKYGHQQFGRYFRSQDHASVQELGDRIAPHDDEQGAEVLPDEAKCGVGYSTMALREVGPGPRPAPQRAVQSHEGRTKLRLEDQKKKNNSENRKGIQHPTGDYEVQVTSQERQRVEPHHAQCDAQCPG